MHPHQFLVLQYKTLNSQQVTTESENLLISLKRFDLTSVYCVHVLKYHTELKNIANQYMPVEHNIIIIRSLVLCSILFPEKLSFISEVYTEYLSTENDHGKVYSGRILNLLQGM